MTCTLPEGTPRRLSNSSIGSASAQPRCLEAPAFDHLAVVLGELAVLAGDPLKMSGDVQEFGLDELKGQAAVLEPSED